MKSHRRRGAFGRIGLATGLGPSTVNDALRYGAVPKYDNAKKLRDALAAEGCDLPIDDLMAEFARRAAVFAARRNARRSSAKKRVGRRAA